MLPLVELITQVSPDTQAVVDVVEKDLGRAGFLALVAVLGYIWQAVTSSKKAQEFNETKFSKLQDKIEEVASEAIRINAKVRYGINKASTNEIAEYAADKLSGVMKDVKDRTPTFDKGQS